MNEEFLTYWADRAFWISSAFLVCVLLAEGWWAQSPPRGSLGRRWLANLFLFGFNFVAMRWTAAFSLMAAAAIATEHRWGLCNWLGLPPFVALMVSILAIDLADYFVHWLKHRVPLLWRLHRVHHSDPDVDATTTYRFHPLELVLRAGVQTAVAIAVGLTPVAAAGYVLLTAFTSVLSHANVRVPGLIDRVLGMIVITPNMHRTHHSIDEADANSNFGVCISFWDRLFGTYRAEPVLGHKNLTFGVGSRTVEDGTSMLRILIDPFLPEHVPSRVRGIDPVTLQDAKT